MDTQCLPLPPDIVYLPHIKPRHLGKYVRIMQLL